MSRLMAVIDRELRAAFRGPIAYALCGLYLVLHGVLFAQLMEDFSGRSFQALTDGNLPGRLNLVDTVLRQLVMADAFILLFLLPGLTMRLMADEWRQRTSDLLLSYPLREYEIILGKFLASLLVVTAMVVLGSIYPIAVSSLGSLEWPVLLTGHVGIILFGAAILAIGLFFSTLTENQVVAFGATWATIFGLISLSFWAPRVAPPLDGVLRHLSPNAHLDPLGYGVLRASDIVYFASVIGLFLFLATGVLEARRWRRPRSRA